MGGASGEPGGDGLRAVLAPNASPMTLDGTRTWIVGVRAVAILDPGSASPAHLDRLVAEVALAARVAIVLTHDHPDHATGARELAERLDATVLAAADGTLAPGDEVDTDAGALVVVPTPGHSPDHVALHWPARRAVFVGDLMMGGLHTAVVAAPDGDLAEYLASLERVRALDADILYPAHGPPFDDPAEAIDDYIRHREDRMREVLDALATGAADVAAITDAVYGDALDPHLRGFAEGAVRVYLEHLERGGRVRREGTAWRD